MGRPFTAPPLPRTSTRPRLSAPPRLIGSMPVGRTLTPAEVIETLTEHWGTKVRSRVHTMTGTFNCTLPVNEVGHQMAGAPDDILLLPKRLDHGHVTAVVLRAGSIGYVEEA